MHGGSTFWRRSAKAPFPARIPGEPVRNDTHRDAEMPDEKPRESSRPLDPVLLKAVYSAEFVPSGFVPQHHETPQNDKRNHPNENVWHNEEQHQIADGFGVDEEPLAGDDMIVAMFSSLLLHITAHPVFLDIQQEEVPHIVAALSGIKSEETFNFIVDMLVEQSIFERNFRYNGAKLAAAFAKAGLEVKLENKCVAFRDIFFRRVQQQYKKCVDLIKMTSTDDAIAEVVGSALFLGELLCNMKIQGKLNSVLLMGTLMFANLLIAHPNNKTVSCLSTLIKLVGPTLDSEEKHSQREIERMYDNTQRLYLELLNKDIVEKEVASRLLAAYKLHTQDWGRNMPDEPEREEGKVQPSAQPQRLSPSPDNWDEYGPSFEQVPEVQLSDEEDNDYMEFLRETGQI